MPNFNARIPKTIRPRKRINRRRYDTLPDTDRDFDYQSGKRIWLEILPPIPNPIITKLEKKLARYKMPFTKIEDSDFVRFTA